MTMIGYARVSTDGQSVDAQVAELMAAGADKVFKEKVTGTKTDRLELKRAMAAVQAGDVFIVTRLDRLARSTRDLLAQRRLSWPVHRQLSWPVRASASAV